MEEYQGSTAAAASANRDLGNNRDGPSDSDDNGAPQDEQRQAVEAAAEAAAAAGISGYLQNGQVSRINGWFFPQFIITIPSRQVFIIMIMIMILQTVVLKITRVA